MHLHLQTQYESKWAQGQWQKISAAWEEDGHLALSESMEQADAILITLADPASNYADAIRNIAASKAYREFPDKSFVFDTQATAIGLFPGLYSSLRKPLFGNSRHRTGCYMQSFNEFIRADDTDEPTPLQYLFSFRGALTSKVRNRLFSIDYGRDDVLVERTHSFWANTGDAEHHDFKKLYAESILSSKFVLCPRGISASSFRLFETMQSGRVPVILSDPWVPPRGIDWDRCTLRVRERDIERLPEICLANEGRWKEMAQDARVTWEKWFSPAGMGRLVKTSLQDIAHTRRFGEWVYRADWPIRHAAAGLRRAAIRTITRIKELT